MENREVAVRLKSITKTFGSTVANNRVSLDIKRGEILALLGENGSGKTTLMNMLSGIYFPDDGHIFINGHETKITSPRVAFEHGIGMIHQHFKLVDVLTAAENIILGLDDGKRLNLEEVSKKVRELCDTYGFDIDPNQKIYDMSVSQKQTVEIVKVLYRGADILILDEPTAVLTPQETDKLFAVLRNMREDGKAIVIITHKMHEVLAVSDRVAVLRKGQYIGEVSTDKANRQSLTDMMVGRAVSLNIDRPEPVNSKPRLDIRNLNVTTEDGIHKLKDVSFTVNSGEILGVAGISGCGQKELLEAIAGLQKADSGEIIFYEDDGSQENILGKDPIDISKKGMTFSFVPEDRLGMGLVGNLDLSENMLLRSYRDGKGIFADRKFAHKRAENIVEELAVVTPSIETPVRRLSGGNVQKVLVGREIELAPKVLLTAYAVRGLDINSSHTIYDLLNKQKQNGVAVVYVGEDLDVLLELSDRILVLCDGRVSGIVDGRSAEKNQIGLMMTHVEEVRENA
ncbi:MAG: ABC transporter ATP-binding protein [Clostridia bacterium]|nr:ABC transporter ATP-binding protein [Clostridia bacterium]